MLVLGVDESAMLKPLTVVARTEAIEIAARGKVEVEVEVRADGGARCRGGRGLDGHGEVE